MRATIPSRIVALFINTRVVYRRVRSTHRRLFAVRDCHGDGARRGVTGGGRARDGHGVAAPRAVASPLRAKLDAVRVEYEPVGRGVAVARAVDRLVAGDSERADHP